jgi:NAD(P)-dependent dehydrogenase (short-subunit alcohol dehydrogenase family)
MNSKQVVLITGSSTGFGRLFADTLARKGHTVFATMRDPGGRNAKNASEIRALAEKDSLPMSVLELDVTDDASVERAVNAAVAKAGRIDVAINNAGYVVSGLAESYSYELASQGIESVIVEPGPYETPVTGKMVVAADEARTNTYGAVKQIAAKINAALASMAGNAQEVADAVLRIIETPAGEKRLRYLVSTEGFGVDQINALSGQVQANLLGALGLTADIKFLKGKAVGSV